MKNKTKLILSILSLIICTGIFIYLAYICIEGIVSVSTSIRLFNEGRITNAPPDYLSTLNSAMLKNVFSFLSIITLFVFDCIFTTIFMLRVSKKNISN